MKRARVLRRWWSSRDFSRLPGALPALLVCLIWIVFLFFVAGWSMAHTEARYRTEAASAMNARDFETARVAYQRLMTLRNERFGEYTFNMALALAGLERTTESASLLGLMAPLNERGYPPAHMFLARTMLAQTNLNPTLLRTAEAHLLRVVAVEPNNLDAHEMLGRIYIELGLLEPAKKHLAEVVPARGEIALLMASVLRAQGDEAGARGWADRAVSYLSARLAQTKTDDSKARLACADALVMLKNYEQALKLLDSAYNQFANPAYAQAIGGVCALWSFDLAKDQPLANLPERIRLIQHGIKLAPKNAILLRELIELSHLEGTEGEKARAAINEMLAKGGETAVLHFCLGGDAWLRGDKPDAGKHFSLAFSMSPELPLVANNMAMVLATEEKPDLDRALQIIEPLVERFPDDASFHDTRGRILLKQGRYESAIKELELALPKASDKITVHRALADAYGKLGLETPAAEHARLAGSTNSPAIPNQPSL